MLINSGQTMQTNLTTAFFLTNKNHFISLVVNQLRCPGNSTQPGQNARISTSVVKLDSCKKLMPKHKYFKSNGELCISAWKLYSATFKWKINNSFTEHQFNICGFYTKTLNFEVYKYQISNFLRNSAKNWLFFSEILQTSWQTCSSQLSLMWQSKCKDLFKEG